jgi:hypothetical protein
MSDLLDLIVRLITDQATLKKEVALLISQILATAEQNSRNIVQAAEEAVRRNPDEAFPIDENGFATLSITGNNWRAGRFDTISIGELKAHLSETVVPNPKAIARLWVLEGACPATDIGALQATCSNTLFQVASQFNCLESPGQHVTAVMNYFSDLTQGPRASISAFPATLLRHYRAPDADGTKFVQHTNGKQVDLLKDACPGIVRNGYFTGKGLQDPQAAAQALEANFDKIKIGIHDGAQVVLGYNWDGGVAASDTRLITQVFTSTVAAGGYDGHINLGESAFNRASVQLLRAAYLGTILTAVALGHRKVLLTLIGGGVFRNPIRDIWNAIQWAIEETKPYLSADLEIFLNGYSPGRLISLDELIPSIAARNGALVCFSPNSLLDIRRN